MSNEPMLQAVTETRDPLTQFGYPAASLVLQLRNSSNTVHLIFGSGDAGDAPGALYANAPNGSIYIPLTATALNMKIYVKFGVKGGITGTWVATAALT